MRIVQTFYSYAKESEVLVDAAGFLSADMNWKSMALSCLLLKKHFGSVTLYCNKRVSKVVSEILRIPYDDIVIIPDFMEMYEGCNLWALPKIYTYSKQTGPFLHVDCDWFMFEKLSQKLLNADVIGQNVEYDDQMYNRRTLEKFISNGCLFPDWVLKDYHTNPILRVINAGILGGNDIEFIQTYLKEIKDFIDNNLTVLRKMNDGFINSIYEQLFFYLMVKENAKSIGLCTEGDKLSTKFDWLPVNLSYAPKSGYMHLLADVKRRFNTYVFVSRYLDTLSPELSYRITRICSDNGINPLINYPHWDIYTSKFSRIQDDLAYDPHTDGRPLKGFEHSISHLEEYLSDNAKTISSHIRSEVSLLYTIPNLKGYKFELAKNIRISEISKEKALICLNSKSGEQVSKIADKVYAISIPDSMLMKVVNLIVIGIRVSIIDCIISNGPQNIEQIATYIINTTPSLNTSEWLTPRLDSAIRGMIVSGILKIKTCGNSR